MIPKSGYRFSEKIVRKLNVRPRNFATEEFPWLKQR